MTIEFRFNGARQCIISPENGRDKMMLQLFIGEARGLKLLHGPASCPEALVIEAEVEAIREVQE